MGFVEGFVRLRMLPGVLAARKGGESRVALPCVSGVKQDVVEADCDQ